MAFQLGLLAWVTAASLYTYEALQGPTELLYWDKTNAYTGFKATSAGQTVWQYMCPETTAPLAQGSSIPDSVHLTWIGGNNAWQYLECAPIMTSNRWTAIFTNIPPTATTNAYIHIGAGGLTNLFYRIRAKR